MNFRRVKIITTVPLDQADKTRQALDEDGVGKLGEYNFCKWTGETMA